MSRIAHAVPAPRLGATALVTGASSGMGDAFARELARLGHHVTLVARREDRLQRLANELPRALPVPCDVADADSRARLLARLERARLEVDVLVNCAGFGGVGPVYEYDASRATEMLRTNVEAVFALCGALTPGMARRRRGAVVIVSSLAGLLRPPVRFAAYGASKCAALRYAEALHHEMRPVHVAVTALCPGPVDTEFGAVSGLDSMMAATPRFARSTPAECVAVAFDALRRGRTIAIPNRFVRVSAAFAQRLPPALAARLLPAVLRA